MDQFHEEMQRQIKKSVRKEAEDAIMFGDYMTDEDLIAVNSRNKGFTSYSVRRAIERMRANMFPKRKRTYAETSFGYIRLL